MKLGRGNRRLLSGLLAAVLLLGSTMTGSASEVTEPTQWTEETEPGLPEETVEGTTAETTSETTVPETVNEGTEPTESPAETQVQETEPLLVGQLLSRMEALKEEAGNLSAELEILDEFSQRVREVWNEGYDAFDRGEITEEELDALDGLGWEILEVLEAEYRYRDGVIDTMDIRRHGSRETPMGAEQNSVASLDNSSGIRFRIFNYTNGKDASGNYITAGGINDNGLSGYFDFRGTSYENTASDGSQVSNVTNSVTDIDGYTANHATVLPNLGADGYPVFDGSRDSGPQKSLGYLFGAGGKGVTGYTAGNTPLRLNSRGQYYYNSAENAVDFDASSRRFIVRTYRERGKTTAGMGSGQYYDFFPFTYWDGVTQEAAGTANWYNYNNTEEVDYWFGMTMEASFSMPERGQVQDSPMVFEFSGDDDVWVFIDDVLVLDLGGTHGVVSGSINFATGEVKQYLDWNGTGESSAGTSYPTTLKTRFNAAGKEPKGGWNGDVFANYTEHTIKFYYLERATSCANCKILFNMPILPTGTLTVEKQLEEPQTAETAGEEYGFTLVRKTDSGETGAGGVSFDRIDVRTGEVLETGTTDAQGGFSLRAGQRAEFDLTAGKTYLVRETDPGQYAQAVGCTVNGRVQPKTEETDPVTIDPEIPAEIIFLNRLETTAVTVKKLVAGNMGDRDQAFSFRGRLYTADPEKGGTFMPFPEPGEDSGYTLEAGEARFSLRHGQTLRLEGIPLGAWLTVTEEMEAEYETLWQAEGTSIQGRTVPYGPTLEPVELVCTNTREALIDTGVALDTAPYLLMCAGGLLPLLRRRKRE